MSGWGFPDSCALKRRNFLDKIDNAGRMFSPNDLLAFRYMVHRAVYAKKVMIFSCVPILENGSSTTITVFRINPIQGDEKHAAVFLEFMGDIPFERRSVTRICTVDQDKKHNDPTEENRPLLPLFKKPV